MYKIDRRGAGARGQKSFLGNYPNLVAVLPLLLAKQKLEFRKITGCLVGILVHLPEFYFKFLFYCLGLAHVRLRTADWKKCHEFFNLRRHLRSSITRIKTTFKLHGEISFARIIDDGVFFDLYAYPLYGTSDLLARMVFQLLFSCCRSNLNYVYKKKNFLLRSAVAAIKGVIGVIYPPQNPGDKYPPLESWG